MALPGSSPKFYVLLLVTLVLCLCVPSFSQFENATVSGTITDPSGAIVPGAQVKLTNVNTGITATVPSNESGLYVFSVVHPGQYRMTVEKPGFRQIVLTDMTVNVQDTLSRNFKLQLGVVGESVTVTGGIETINTVSAAVSTVVDSQFVENMPLNGRSFQSLIELTPGVLITPVSSGFSPGMFSVDGQRTNTNYFTVDGVSANFGTNTGFEGAGQSYGGSTPAVTSGGGTNGLVSVDAMQEFRIQTSSYAPEFGRSPGAQISIVTKGGTNQWHGTASDYLRNDIFDARNWFDNPPLPKPPVRQNDFGGTFGGPIWKDHTFFFFSYEGLRLRLPETATGYYFDAAAKASVPSTSPWQPIIAATPTGPAPLPDGSNLLDPTCDNVTNPCLTNLKAAYSNPSSFNAYSLRLDHKLTDKITLFARYNHAPSTDGSNYVTADQVNWANTDTATFGLTAAVSPTLVNDFRGNWSRSRSGFTYVLQSAYGAVAPPTSAIIPSAINTGNFNVSYLIDAGGGSAQVSEGTLAGAAQRQLNFVDTLSRTVGSHQLKFGVDYRRMMSTELAGSELSIVPYSWSSILNGTVDLMLNDTGDQISSHLNNWSLFGQDTWKASRRLTLTYGLRWEINTPPASDTAGKPLYSLDGVFNSNPVALVTGPLWHTDYSAFAPRFGAAFQINPKTVLRGGFGLFYDLGYGAGTGLDMGSAYPYFRQAVYFGIPLDLSSSAFAPIPFPNPPQLISSSIDFVGLPSVDPNLRLPVTYQWNAAIERELGNQQSITATYVGANGRKLLFDQYLTNIPLPNDGGTTTSSAERNAGISHYNALQLQFLRRMSHGLQALVSYGYSHSSDLASTEYGQPGTFTSIGALKLPPLTPSDYDYHNRFSAAISYNVPKTAWGGKAGKEVFNGWALDGIYRFQSVPPLDVTMTEVIPGLGYVTVRPVLTGQPIWIPDAGQPAGKTLNPAAFTLSANGASNDALRNGIRSLYNISQADLALRRRFNLTERVKLDARAEYFNIFNHPMFGSPATWWGECFGTTPASCTYQNSSFGSFYNSTLNQALGGGAQGNGGQSAQYAVGGPRSAQFTLKITF